MITFIQGDVLERLAQLPHNHFQAALFDPPYGLKGLGWDSEVHSEIALNAPFWEGLKRVLMPFGIAAAFSAARLYHRLAAAAEDAGFDIMPLFGWLKPNGTTYIPALKGDGLDGFVYGISPLRATLEPVLWARKRYTGWEKDIEVIRRTGAGLVNARTSGVPRRRAEQKIRRPYYDHVYRKQCLRRVKSWQSNPYRMGGNLVLMHEPDCTPAQCVKGCAAARLNALGARREPYIKAVFNRFEQIVSAQAPTIYCARAENDERDAGVPEALAAPNSHGELVRNPHPTVKPFALCMYLAYLLLPPARYAPMRRILVPFSGSGTEAIAAYLAGWDEVVAIEINPAYIEVARGRAAHWANYRAEALADIGVAEATQQAAFVQQELF